MENVRDRMNLHLTTDHDNAIKWFSKPEFKTNTHANGLYLMETYKTKSHRKMRKGRFTPFGFV